MRKGRSYELSRCVRCTRESNTTGRRGEGTPKAHKDLVLFRRKTAAAKPWPRPRPGWGGRRASCILVGEGANVLPEARIIAITKMRIWLCLAGGSAAGKNGD